MQDKHVFPMEHLLETDGNSHSPATSMRQRSPAHLAFCRRFSVLIADNRHLSSRARKD
jgi:hypothetical protein